LTFPAFYYSAIQNSLSCALYCTAANLHFFQSKLTNFTFGVKGPLHLHTNRTFVYLLLKIKQASSAQVRKK